MKEALDMLNNSSPLSSLVSSSSPNTQKMSSTPSISRWRKDLDRDRSSSSLSSLSSLGKDFTKEQTPLPKSPSHSSKGLEFFSRADRQTRNEDSKMDAENKPGGSDSVRDSKSTSIPFYDVRSGKFYDNGKDLKTAESCNGHDTVLRGEGVTSEQSAVTAEVTWSERKARMDSALSWLTTELVSIDNHC